MTCRNKAPSCRDVISAPTKYIRDFVFVAVSAFKPDVISHMVLQKMLKQNIVFTQRVNQRYDEANFLYKRNKPADYFILIIEVLHCTYVCSYSTQW